jgi:Protein of unknown function (DUF1236)
MKNRIRLAVAAVALLSGVSVAIAAGSSMSKESTAKSASTSMLKDKLSLTSKQQTTAWQDISKQATKEKAPARFAAKIGAAVPSTVMTYPVPTTVSSRVPVLRGYQYALLQNNRLLIVNPHDKKVADVITR